MAEEYKPEIGSHGAEAAGTENHGLSRYGDKKDQDVLAADFDEKVTVTEKDEEKKPSLFENLNRPLSTGPSRDEEAGEDGENEKKKGLTETLKEEKEEDTSLPVEAAPPVAEQPHPEVKKGLTETLKEKFEKKEEDISLPVEAAPPVAERPHPEVKKGSTETLKEKFEKKDEDTSLPAEEKKGLLEEIKDKIHEFQSKTEEEKHKEKA